MPFSRSSHCLYISFSLNIVAQLLCKHYPSSWSYSFIQAVWLAPLLAWSLQLLWLGENFYALVFILGFYSGGWDGKESACNTGNPGSIPESGRYPGEGNGNPLQYFGLDNPINSRAWQATRGHKEQDPTEQLTLSFLLLFFIRKTILNLFLIDSPAQLSSIQAEWLFRWLTSAETQLC